MAFIVKKRLKLFKHIRENFKHFEPVYNHNCIEKTLTGKVINKTITLEELLGAGANGEVYKGCVERTSNEGCKTPVTIKVIPIYDHFWFNMETYNELLILAHSNELISQGVSANLPLTYYIYHCNICHYDNKELINKNTRYRLYKSFLDDRSNLDKFLEFITETEGRPLSIEKSEIIDYVDLFERQHVKTVEAYITEKVKTTRCMIALTEYYDMNLKNWIDTLQFNFELPNEQTLVWQVFVFHLAAALCNLKYNLRYNHNDLHIENILVKKTNFGGPHTQYIINNRTYYVPDAGSQFILWDFGKASPVTIKSDEEITPQTFRKDLEFFAGLQTFLLSWSNTQAADILSIRWNQEHYAFLRNVEFLASTLLNDSKYDVYYRFLELSSQHFLRPLPGKAETVINLTKPVAISKEASDNLSDLILFSKQVTTPPKLRKTESKKDAIRKKTVKIKSKLRIGPTETPPQIRRKRRTLSQRMKL